MKRRVDLVLFRADHLGPSLDRECVSRVANAVLDDGRVRAQFSAAGNRPIEWVEGKSALENEIDNRLTSTAGFSLAQILESARFSDQEKAVSWTSFQHALSEAFREWRIISFRCRARGWEFWPLSFNPDRWAELDEDEWRFLLSADLPERYVYDGSGLRSAAALRVREEAFALAECHARAGWPWRTKAEALDAIQAEVRCARTDAEAAWRTHAPDAGKRGRKTSRPIE